MWVNNKTSKWIHDLPERKRAELMNDARSRAPTLLQKFKERMTKLKKEKWQLLQEKHKKKQAKEKKQVSEKAGLVEGSCSKVEFGRAGSRLKKRGRRWQMKMKRQ